MDEDRHTAPVSPRGGRRPAAALAGAAVAGATLTTFHPVLETLGRNPEFFVARATPRWDALAVAAVLAVVLPAVIWVGVFVLGRLWPWAGATASAIVLAGSGVAVALQFTGPPLARVIIGAVAGVALFVGLVRAPRLWPGVRWAAVVPALSFAFFLFALPVSRVVWSASEGVAPELAATQQIPVVVVIFDELPLASLLAGPHEINADRFPNFAALADDATWYPNATTVTDQTAAAVPAILTGMRPADGSLPIAADHPQSVFTLLAETHDVRAVEPVTAVCPEVVCGEAEFTVASTPRGFGSLIEDVRLIGMHALLPEEWTRDLPPIDQTWGGFADAVVRVEGAEPDRDFNLAEHALEVSKTDRTADWRGVIEPPGERPPAYLLHTTLPHVPYRYLPSGQETLQVALAGLGPDGIWDDDRWLIEHAHRQHLLQVGLADRMVGELVDDLRSAGLYEDAIIAVTADHGVAFRSGLDRRRGEAGNLPDIAAVPMFVRYPDGRQGQVDDRPVETIDLVPTITDLLDIKPANALHGVSLLDDATARPDERTMTTFTGPLSYLPDEANAWRLGRSVQERFGRTWDDLYASVPDGELIGREVSEFDVEATSILVSIDHRARLLRYTATSNPIVGVVAGGLGFANPPRDHIDLAVAFDGTIVATGRTTELHGDIAPFHALIAPSWYGGDVEPASGPVPGRSIEVYRIRPDGTLEGPLIEPGS